jgi:hypothetical protein
MIICNLSNSYKVIVKIFRIISFVKFNKFMLEYAFWSSLSSHRKLQLPSMPQFFIHFTIFFLLTLAQDILIFRTSD